jgi:hypothetical protein
LQRQAGIIAKFQSDSSSTSKPRKLDRSFARREYDLSLLEDPPEEVDACRERGEAGILPENEVAPDDTFD